MNAERLVAAMDEAGVTVEDLERACEAYGVFWRDGRPDGPQRQRAERLADLARLLSENA